MEVDREALWVLIAVCCAPALLVTLRMRLRGRTWRERPAALADAVLTGVGAGLAAATVLLVLSALWVRIVP